LRVGPSKAVESTTAEIQVAGAATLAPINDLNLNGDPVDGDRNRLKAMGTSVPGWSVQSGDVVTVNILFAARTHPDGVVCKLPRRSLLERIVPGRQPGRRVRGSGGESNCEGGESQEE